jgi:hypothetical protein
MNATISSASFSPSVLFRPFYNPVLDLDRMFFLVNTSARKSQIENLVTL